jgi:hypothetical protein
MSKHKTGEVWTRGVDVRCGRRSGARCPSTHPPVEEPASRLSHAHTLSLSNSGLWDVSKHGLALHVRHKTGGTRGCGRAVWTRSGAAVPSPPHPPLSLLVGIIVTPLLAAGLWDVSKTRFNTCQRSIKQAGGRAVWTCVWTNAVWRAVPSPPTHPCEPAGGNHTHTFLSKSGLWGRFKTRSCHMSEA